jgi:hypothetical protein
VVSWEVVYAKQAMKDAKKLAASGLKPKAQELLAVLATTHFKIHRPSKSWSVILLAHTPAASIFSTALCMRFYQRENGSCLAYVDAL